MRLSSELSGYEGKCAPDRPFFRRSLLLPDEIELIFSRCIAAHHVLKIRVLLRNPKEYLIRFWIIQPFLLTGGQKVEVKNPALAEPSSAHWLRLRRYPRRLIPCPAHGSFGPDAKTRYIGTSLSSSSRGASSTKKYRFNCSASRDCPFNQRVKINILLYPIILIIFRVSEIEPAHSQPERFRENGLTVVRRKLEDRLRNCRYRHNWPAVRQSESYRRVYRSVSVRRCTASAAIIRMAAGDNRRIFEQS